MKSWGALLLFLLPSLKSKEYQHIKLTTSSFIFEDKICIMLRQVVTIPCSKNTHPGRPANQTQAQTNLYQSNGK